MLFTKNIWHFYRKLRGWALCRLYGLNSERYWDYRIENDWNASGGRMQTQIFAASFFANVKNINFDHVDSVLDFGCASGDSAPIFHCFMPHAELFLYDMSPSGIKQGLGHYADLDVKAWDGQTRCNLVYCSNVIEHVLKPEDLIDTLVSASNRYICIQCPWDERHQNGDIITTRYPLGEHIWTINEEFVRNYLQHPQVESWQVLWGEPTFAWPNGRQSFFIGKVYDDRGP